MVHPAFHPVKILVDLSSFTTPSKTLQIISHKTSRYDVKSPKNLELPVKLERRSQKGQHGAAPNDRYYIFLTFNFQNLYTAHLHTL